MQLGLIFLFHVVVIMGGFTWVAIKTYLSPNDLGKNQRAEMAVCHRVCPGHRVDTNAFSLSVGSSCISFSRNIYPKIGIVLALSGKSAYYSAQPAPL